MAEENIKDFSINWLIVGLLFVSMISFATLFMFENNPLGFDDSSGLIFNATKNSMSSKIYESPDDADVILNITANTNPEASDLGSRDSVASAYKMKDAGVGFITSSKMFLMWIFAGEIGKMLLAVLGGIIGFSTLYYITKYFRTGS